MRNYDTTEVGVTYTRVPEIVIDYKVPLTAVVRCIEIDAIKMANGELLQYGSPSQFEFTINPSDMTEMVQLVSPETGADIEGETVMVQQIMMGILAVIRSRQKTRDFSEG